MSLVMAFALKILGHTSILNGYLNMSAELTRFADRQFFSVSILHIQEYPLHFSCRNGGRVLRIPLTTESGTHWYTTGYTPIFI